MEEKVLKALGDPTRFRLLQLMARRSYCVGALARISRMSQSAVSQHLKVLREAGLAYGEKIGYYTHYRVDKQALEKVVSALQAILVEDRRPCDGPFYGCPQSEYVRCRAYVPPEEREKENRGVC